MSLNESSISNLTYTNKDFNSIYNEILDLADKLSPTWNPSTSHESDPGVVLLKLDALMADKAHYNIDKNILELFPESVTQYPNAREIFNQCGYIMHHYQSAQVEVLMNVYDNPIEDSSITSVDLPYFTQICDKDNTIVFTIIPRSNSEYKKLSLTNEIVEYLAFQGTCIKYTLNNSSQITYDSLDYNNRIYFKEINVAENGIFICSYKDGTPTKNYTQWQKVDNLMTQPLGTYCYKFGVSRDGNNCYIEFPTDIGNIIGEGIEINYLLSNGSQGNITSQVLTNFVNDKIQISGTEFSSENIYIRNLKTAYGGKDPETIEEARSNYERIKNTFDTLVSLHDYENYIKSDENVANAFVCDRTCDLQSTTRIISFDEGIEVPVTQIHRYKKSASDDYEITSMNAFDLKLYALSKPQSEIDNTSQFDITFTPISSDVHTAIVTNTEIEYIKSIQHDFIDVRNAHEVNLDNNIYKLIGIQMQYGINAKIIPYAKLDILQQLEIQGLIINALCKNLNSSKIEFGQSISYATIYDIIMGADPRIKAIILNDIEYTPYALIPNSTTGNIDYIDLTNESAKSLCNYIIAKCILAGVTPLYNFPESFDRLLNEEEKLPSSYSGDKSAGIISSEVKFNFSVSASDSKDIEVGPNESIYLTYPNMVVKESYSNYCKYYLVASNTILKDSPYILSSNESITFFYKKNSNDSSYTYYKYGAGTIIQPNFDLSYQQNLSIEEDIINDLGDSTIEATLDPDQSNIISKYDSCILDQSKAIDIVDTNKITFPQSTRLYWILNNREYDTTTNKDIYTLMNQGEAEYTLKSGEYLFYTNATASTFALLGSGTRITRTNTTEAMSVEARTYEEILYGKNNLLTDNNLWKYYNYVITATEMKFYNFGEGSVITFTNNSDTTANIEINNNRISGLTNIDISYKEASNSTSISLPNLSNAGVSWSGYSRLFLTCGPESPQVFSLEANDCRSYKIILNKRWDDTDKKFKDITPSNYYEISPDTDEAINLKLKSKYDISNIAGENIDITYRDNLGHIVNNEFYLYEESTDTAFSIMNNILISKLAGSSNQISLRFTLSKGEYILPIYVPTDFSNLTLLINSYKVLDPEETASGETDSNVTCTLINSKYFKLKGMHYYNINVNGNDNNTAVTLGITTTDTIDKDYTFRFYPLTKYSKTGSFSNDSSITAAIKTLDPDNLFNYAHRVSDDMLISDPISSDAFFDSNHPYNKYVICKWDHENSSSINIVNKVK